MKLELRNSLSVKLLRVVLLSALAVGVVLSCAQIIYDTYKTRQAVDSDAQRILDMFRDPSTQAVYSLDREMGMQVMEGLFQDESVRMASIGHPNETMLAEKSRPLQDMSMRWLTDLILGQERTYTTQLVGRGPYSEYYGDLSITLDTSSYGKDFLINAVIIFISGVLRAMAMGLVLYLVYHWLLTKPLSKIIEHLTQINPDRPSQHQIPLLKGHEKNELGLWVNTANQLLASIERNTHLRHEAENSLQRMAQYDFLTGLPNRQQLQQQLDKILVDGGRLQHRVAVLCVGLDDSRVSTNNSATRSVTSCCWPWPIDYAPTAAAWALWRGWAATSSPWYRPISSSPMRLPNWRKAFLTTWKYRSTSTTSKSACARPSASPSSPKTVTAPKNCCRKPNRP